MTTVLHASVNWRKSTQSTGSNTCVELAYVGLVRDSKDPAGPVLRADLAGFVCAVKAGRLDG